MSEKRSSDRRSATAGNAGQGSNWIRKDKRLAIYERDGWRCVWCEHSVTNAKGLQLGTLARLATLDHFLARSRGGTNHEGNLLTCCMQCNERRGDRSALEYASELSAGKGAEARTVWGAAQKRALILQRVLEALDRPIVRRKHAVDRALELGA